MRERSVSPTKAGNLYGKFTPSKLGSVLIKTTDGKLKRVFANRKERRHGSPG